MDSEINYENFLTMYLAKRAWIYASLTVNQSKEETAYGVIQIYSRKFIIFFDKKQM